MDRREHRFRPRMRGLALSAMALALGLGALAALAGNWTLAALAAVVAIVVYRNIFDNLITRDDDGLEVGSPGRRRFRLAWGEVVRVVASPTTGTCFVDGGAPERSLLVPGDGAPAGYDLDDKPALFATILARVPAERVETVTRLDAPRA